MLEVFQLAVRVRIRLKKQNFSQEIVALVNSGYEAETPQLLIPVNLAKTLNLWPPPPEAIETVFNTAGGPLKVWVVPKAVEGSVIAEDSTSKEVKIDIVISPLADEPLISDMLTGAFEIAIEDAGKGLWRFRWESKEKVRETVKP